MRTTLSLFLLLISSTALAAQSPATQPTTSPEAAYNQAVAPVEITHRSIANWSDVEIAALSAAILQAKGACFDRASVPYTGEDLISYAKLCAFGQQWPAALKAATTYIKSADTAKPPLSQAFAYQIQAELNLNDEQAALVSSLEMLQAVPYGQLTDEVMTSSVNYLKIAFPYDALVLQNIRQPILLRLLRDSQAMTPLPPGAPSPVPPHTLFEHALDEAALQQYINQPQVARSVVTDLDAATPANLSPDESILIAAARRQYALLGTHLPPIAISATLSTPSAPARINPDFGSSTVLILFPPWCGQCIRMAHSMATTLQRLSEKNIHIYGLLADNPPPPPSEPVQGAHGRRPTPSQRKELAPVASSEPPSAVDQLRGTPSFVVTPSTLNDFVATDFPFLIATDHNGIIRLLLPALADNAFVPGGTIDQLITQIAKEWPVPSTN